MGEEILTSEEFEFYAYLNGKSGSFTTRLLDAIIVADIGNKYKLSLGFPEYVELVSRYQNEKDFYQNLEDKIKQQY